MSKKMHFTSTLLCVILAVLVSQTDSASMKDRQYVDKDRQHMDKDKVEEILSVDKRVETDKKSQIDTLLERLHSLEEKVMLAKKSMEKETVQAVDEITEKKSVKTSDVETADKVSDKKQAVEEEVQKEIDIKPVAEEKKETRNHDDDDDDDDDDDKNVEKTKIHSKKNTEVKVKEEADAKKKSEERIKLNDRHRSDDEDDEDDDDEDDDKSHSDDDEDDDDNVVKKSSTSNKNQKKETEKEDDVKQKVEQKTEVKAKLRNDDDDDADSKNHSDDDDEDDDDKVVKKSSTSNKNQKKETEKEDGAKKKVEQKTEVKAKHKNDDDDDDDDDNSDDDDDWPFGKKTGSAAKTIGSAAEKMTNYMKELNEAAKIAQVSRNQNNNEVADTDEIEDFMDHKLVLAEKAMNQLNQLLATLMELFSMEGDDNIFKVSKNEKKSASLKEKLTNKMKDAAGTVEYLDNMLKSFGKMFAMK